jgi:hypothetical protein
MLTFSFYSFAINAGLLIEKFVVAVYDEVSWNRCLIRFTLAQDV